MDCFNSSFTSNYGFYEKSKKEINETKSYLLESGKYEVFKNVLYANYSKFMSEKYGTELNKKFELYLGVENTLTPFEEKCCIQIFNADRQRTRRLRQKIENKLVNSQCLFLTLTFEDKVLQNTSNSTRRTYIRRYLKDVLKVPFGVANKDFGDKEKNSESKEREHYHAIIESEDIDLSTYPYGFIYAERIKDISNPLLLAKYVNKLTNHAYKDSTKGRDRLIYIGK